VKSLKGFHYYSGITIAAFVFLHLGNHLLSLGGAQKHIEMMQILRVVYRNIFIEVILLLVVAIQIYSGITLYFRKRKYPDSGFGKLQIYSGLYMAFFLMIHVSAVLVGRAILHLDTNFYFGAVGLNSFPVNLFFIPYYGLAILAFFCHIASIHAFVMKGRILGLTSRNQSLVIIGLGFIFTILILLGMTNLFRGIDIPDDYMILTGKF
jgi:hypothetical protein